METLQKYVSLLLFLKRKKTFLSYPQNKNENRKK